MKRCRDYIGFAVWFVGIGYAVLWPLTVDGNGGALFGASIVCGHAAGGVEAVLCGLPHPLALPIGLHVLGFTAAMLVAARLSCRLLRRLRPRAEVIPPAALVARLLGTIPMCTRRKPARPSRRVTPRKHFGLRGMPR